MPKTKLAEVGLGKGALYVRINLTQIR